MSALVVGCLSEYISVAFCVGCLIFIENYQVYVPLTRYQIIINIQGN